MVAGEDTVVSSIGSKKDGHKDKDVLSISHSTSTKHKRTRQVRWNDAMDKALIELLANQVASGNKDDKGFKTSAYTYVCKEMTNQFGIEMKTPHIKSRMRTLKPIYLEAKKLLGTSGFRWNESRNQIQANPAVWEQYLQANPHAFKVKGRVLKMYDEMQVILGIDQVMGEEARIGIELVNELDVEEDSDNDIDVDIYDDASTSLLAIDEFISAIDRMNEAMKKIAAALTVQSDQEFFNELWHEVMNMDGFDPQDLNAVFGYLGQNERKAKVFLARAKPYRAQMVHSIISELPSFGML
ncbi:PREDICTED: uncharacterized protein At2g29880-like [Nelumbo nucifera]|uniref:Uncharacterized protein At2g29880-like n=1 Tax=Nelumbo nucifera TaxID=4432 RepID=A0A1U7Z2W7_NELNU|nr:PREDICTED: uncharacterized protein At2g29880-like [Nelumbo nucifera]XP_010247493.1 PREDICTED: uncharacterized protein At2g29880-like [Nelumbo nucifera]XP_010247494.1 PREDICTED: uncharacterized protein At2g29880-like [Nelumbo nucifera]